MITIFLFTASMLTLLWEVYIGIIIGLAFLYLGIAAVTVPTHPGSWGTIGGATLFEMRHSSQRTPAFAGNPTLTHA